MESRRMAPVRPALLLLLALPIIIGSEVGKTEATGSPDAEASPAGASEAELLLLQRRVAAQRTGDPAGTEQAQDSDATSLLGSRLDRRRRTSGGAGAEVRVQLPFGELVGSEYDGAAEFRHIPYALPMSPQRRFDAPLDWRGSFENGVRNARPGEVPLVSCETAEDCLYLQVWAPRPQATSTPENSKTYPVMVWIHGGGFYKGSGNDAKYEGATLARQGHVVVNINYRLGSLGWLALEEQKLAGLSTGNFGLLDIQSALRWVQNHIHIFGGDATRVTVYGRSAGAICVLALLVSKQSEGLFSAAVVQSGHAEAKPLPVALNITQEWSKLLGCEEATIACLRGASFEQVREADSKLKDAPFGGEKYRWFVTADNVIIADQPWRLFAKGEFLKIPLGAGIVTDEGTIFSRYKSGWGTDGIMDRSEFREAVENYLDGMSVFYPSFEAFDLASAVEKHYASDMDRHKDDLTPVYARFFGDARFVCPMWNLAHSAAAFVDVWRFRIDLRCYSSDSRSPKYGVYHSAEIPFVFKNVGDACVLDAARMGGVASPADRATLASVNEDLLTFVASRAYPSTWEKFNASSNNVLHPVNGGVVEAEAEFRSATCKFLAPYMWT
eukprot:TRINITY_DN13314_c1_g2_i1.p1 TRINITY_DN13314_c1_g2~~TRINITY_DN13314_c1_g2_i1.p1  ORF type:complete len:623 (-),score=100.91 TRINITY_DN13314_c1_g2_i1:464-2299(-)